MKPLSILAALFLSFTASAATLSFTWVGPQPSEFGGLSTNDYMTNITFRVYASPNVTTPLTNWTMVATFPGQPFLAQGPLGSQWTNSIATPPTTRFYVMTTFSAKALGTGGGESPFSNQDFLLATLVGATLNGINPK